MKEGGEGDGGGGGDVCGEGTNNDWLPGQHFIYQLILHWAHLFRNSAIKQKYLERRKFYIYVFFK